MNQDTAEVLNRIKRLEERLDAANRTPQLHRSSLENGAIREYDADGQLVGQYGRQFDGTHGAVVLAGPNPPTPTVPTLATELRGVTVTWGGGFVDAVAPMDFRHVRAEVSDTADFTGTIRTGPVITSADGGRVFVPWGPAGTPLYARLQCWSQAGKFSAYSAVAGPVPSGQVGIGDLGFALDDYVSGSRIFYGTVTPTATGIGDLWLKQLSAGPPPRFETQQWDGIVWAPAEDQGVTDALAAAVLAQTTADSKTKVYDQPTAPTGLTAADAGTVWRDTDDGNAEYVWGTSTTAFRRNFAVHPSFEVDTAGTVTTVTGWTNYASGSLGTVTRSIVTSGGVADRAKAARAVSSSMAATAGVGVGYQQTVAAVPGDALRVQAVFTVAVTGANFVPYLQVEWLNVGGTVISTPTPTSGSGTVTTAQTLTWSGTAPALAVSARVTLMRRTAATTGSALASASITIDAVLVEKNRVSNALTTYFDGASGGEAAWDGTAEASTSRTYQEGTTGAYAWQPRRLRTGSFEPNSIVAKDVIATGTVTAALLEALMVLTNVLISGNPNGDHARLDSGLRVFALTPDGELVEAGSFGTAGADRMIIIDPVTGKTLATVNEFGITAPAVTTEKLTVGGNTLDYLLGQQAKGLLRRGGIRNSTISTTTTRGAFDVEFEVAPGHAYRISTSTINLNTSSTSTYAFAQVRVRPSADGPPTTGTGIAMDTSNGSTNVIGGVAPITLNRIASFEEMFPVGSVPTVPTKVRVLLCYGVASGGGAAAIFGDGAHPIDLYIEDLGASQPYTGANNDGGGGGGAGGGGVSVVTTVQDFAQAWGSNWKSGADTTPRTDSGDLIQGYTPYYPAPGSEVAMIGFQDLTGILSGATVNWMAIYIYANHWNNNAGGTALIGAHPYLNSPASRPADWQLNLIQSAGWPRGAGRWVYLPASWFAGFVSGANRGITLGDLASTSGEYYGRFDSYPLSSRPVLRISYTK